MMKKGAKFWSVMLSLAMAVPVFSLAACGGKTGGGGGGGGGGGDEPEPTPPPHMYIPLPRIGLTTRRSIGTERHARIPR